MKDANDTTVICIIINNNYSLYQEETFSSLHSYANVTNMQSEMAYLSNFLASPARLNVIVVQ